MASVLVCRSMSAESETSSSWSLPSEWPGTIETAPLGPTTSFTKKATSLIIGPQPASYQPTEPSSKVTCRWP